MEDYVQLTENVLNLEELIGHVRHPAAGAISSFIGTTRDNFEGKKVLRLEYEAYDAMAVEYLKRLCVTIRAKYDVMRIAVAHRIGLVPISEASVIIVISSAHRRESLDATHFAIDELKRTVPIWKKEFYEDGSAWKENFEFGQLKNRRCHH